MTTTETPPADSSTTQRKSIAPWIFFGVSLVGMLVFAGLYLSNAKKSTPEIVEKIVTKTVMNIITNEVTREKIVQVPAPMSEEMIKATNTYYKLMKSSVARKSDVLFNMDDVRVVYALEGSMKAAVSEAEVKAKFELTLRRNNVPLNSQSTNMVVVLMNGFFDEKGELTYSVSCGVSEWQFIFRGNECRYAMVTLWEADGRYGYAGPARMNDLLLTAVEKEAEQFANDYLSANPKPK